jgi:hypothetical protein
MYMSAEELTLITRQVAASASAAAAAAVVLQCCSAVGFMPTCSVQHKQACSNMHATVAQLHITIMFS